jgi:hypothetical protein
MKNQIIKENGSWSVTIDTIVWTILFQIFKISFVSLGGKAKEGVVIIGDIFGFNIPNTKYIADYLAKNGSKIQINLFIN